MKEEGAAAVVSRTGPQGGNGPAAGWASGRELGQQKERPAGRKSRREGEEK